MAITAALVKELRERTGAGMMECKKALVETDGDIEKAIENMRKSGQAKAAKKAGRIAAEGVIVIHASEDGKKVAMAEVNCETDFVAKDENFLSFANAVAERVLESDVEDVEALKNLSLHEGEDATVRMESDSPIAQYRHGVRIGVLVDMTGGDEQLGKDLAMHIAAANPVCVEEGDIPAELLAKEKEIFEAQARESGKPDNIIEKMIEGRMKKYIGEVTLAGQPFVKDPDTKVGKLLEQKGAKVNDFVRFEVGEGIEKKQENFAEEVKAQMRTE